MKKRLILTGGHAATTAVAVVQEIKSENKDWSLYWIGVKNAIEGKKIVTLESEVLPRLGVKFLPLIMGRIQRKFTFWTIPSILKIPFGFIQSFYYLAKIRPNLILSFGGFASFPVVFVAKLFRIPVVIHEQTSAAGRANIVASKFAEKITLSRKESVKFFEGISTEVIGNPVMEEIRIIKYVKNDEPPVVYVTGGSRGSQSINLAIEKILKTLLSRYKVIHQTGGLDYLKFSAISQKLPQALRDNYEVFVRVNPLEVAKIYSKASVIVSRSGANTVSEIMIAKIPAVLIPLPISYQNEQFKNAEIAKKWGIAKVILQNDLTPEKLLKAIEFQIENRYRIQSLLKSKKSQDFDASKKLVKIVGEYMK